jgi:putative ABC transport system ATP-binding protein
VSLECRDLWKSYRPQWRGASSEVIEVVRGVSVAFAPGALVVLSGPSGSGKTTLLNLLVGFEEPDRGVVERPGTTWADVAVVPQALGLLDELTIAENVGLPLRLSGQGRDSAAAERTEAVMKNLDVDRLARRRPRQVSLGEQQRAAIARALVMRPKVLVLDEPTAHQDAGHREAVVAALWEAAGDGAVVLAATHDQDVAGAASRHVRLHAGELTELAPDEGRGGPDHSRHRDVGT